MCGIAGYVGADIQPFRGCDAAMLAAVAYRGPDARTTWSDDRQAVLHHARLSIIDLECGGQPMTDTTGRYTMVFNGAIYNYLELREEYERAGVRFRTHSDTEVLLNGFALKGERVLRELNGMFAFAIWDAQDRRLFMARDRLGKKPLFWTCVGDALMFASTSRAFIGVKGWRGGLSEAGLVLYSFLGGFPSDTTAFTGVYALPPAHAAWFQPGDAGPRLTRYWRADYQQKAAGGESRQLEEYEALLEDAIRIRLRSDVPLALSFSGGVDSGTIAAIAKTRCATDLQCYTLDHDTAEEPSAEVALAGAVAAQLGLPWRHIPFDYRHELLEGLDHAYRDFDQPCQQIALVYSRRLYDVMSQDCRVVLSGNGADELFTGYSGDEQLARIDRLRARLRLVPDAIYRRFPASRRGEWDHIRLDRLTVADWARHDMAAYARQFTSKAAVLDECRQAIGRLCDEVADSGVDTMMDFVMHRALAVSTSDSNYRLADITGYAAHVEVRSPFLDHRLVEFAARLPHRFKVARHRGAWRAKYLPRISYQRAVGVEAAWAPKRGMGANLRWPWEFAHNPKFQQAMAANYAALAGTLDAAPFEQARAGFVADVQAGRTAFPTGSTMMNGFMLGAWMRGVVQHAPAVVLPLA